MPSALFYLLIITTAEIVTVAFHPLLGLGIYTVLLFSIIIQVAKTNRFHPDRLILALSLVTLIRIISLAMPLSDIPQIWWYPIIYLPLLIATIMVAKMLEYTLKDIGLIWGKIPVQILIGLTGIGLGFAEYAILKPDAIAETLSWSNLILPSIILLLTTGFVEELIFRGVLQKAALDSFGSRGIIYISLIFAVLHIGFFSILDIFFVFGVALVFGYLVKKTGSILGVTIAHGLTNIILFAIAPLLLG
ncbi:CPBP family intramembrane metalloprotease [Dehalococcoides mccartyi]|nr:CPBP family intramembrane metalloprotease [Dehalococcoides mccartyi]